MVRSFIYTWKILIRKKAQVFWNLFFPIALATMFHFAFSGLSADEQLIVIPVAVVAEEGNESTTAFAATVEALSTPGEDQLLDVKYTTEEEAVELLENEDVIGILYEGSPVTLSISAGMSSMQLEQSILDAFVTRYNLQAAALEKIATEHPENITKAIQALARETNYNTTVSGTQGNMDGQLTYFFNLLAMTCLFAYMSGLQVAVNNQANLSELGARKCISPQKKSYSHIGEMLAAIIYQYACIFIALLYLLFVLKKDFGSEFGYMSLACLVGCILGISMGFGVGCISRFTEGVKMGIMMGFSMICSFLSGLMVSHMRILVERVCPWINQINPAALIADSFYSLVVYPSHERYFRNIYTMLFISALFLFMGIMLTRRKKYASL